MEAPTPGVPALAEALVGGSEPRSPGPGIYRV